jgi:hypothetical protein
MLHDCVERASGTFAIERIPKRKGALELNVGRVEYAWGLQAQHTISFLRMLFYHALILIGPLGFWGWWQSNQLNDLQNAAIPFTAVTALISLFWSSAGILKVFRESS